MDRSLEQTLDAVLYCAVDHFITAALAEDMWDREEAFALAHDFATDAWEIQAAITEQKEQESNAS